jgi:hypothetical protein
MEVGLLIMVAESPSGGCCWCFWLFYEYTYPLLYFECCSAYSCCWAAMIFSSASSFCHASCNGPLELQYIIARRVGLLTNAGSAEDCH